ncbi:hypothetical protein [Chitinilyticum litopenaei]|uniref:hypothetical protein n=1 Tax=Chitinilyticum litopenaei TaxID=1121276 RepID=UPI0005BA7CF6|nr:hypothetical protein [Chitinilyticum litopenaei]
MKPASTGKALLAGLIAGLLLAVLLPYALGEGDFWLAKQGKKPVFSVLRAAATDGGSGFYKGLGYTLTLYHAFTDSDVRQCTVGPEISYAMPFQLIDDHSSLSTAPC